MLLHGGLMTIDLNFGPLLEPLAAGRQVIAVELQGHGHTAGTGRAPVRFQPRRSGRVRGRARRTRPGRPTRRPDMSGTQVAPTDG